MSRPSNAAFFWQRVKRTLSVGTAGGSWSVQLPDVVQRNLRWYFMDGVLASCQDAINLTYLTLFVLALGANKAQIGLMSSLSSVLAVLLLIPGAILAQRFGSRKWVVVIAGGGIARLAMLGLIIIPFVSSGPTAVLLAIAMKLIMDGFNNLSMPAWTSLTADVVPLAWRGRYFGSRNISMSVANILVTFIAGQIITLAMAPIIGYQIVYGVAFLFGAGATFCYAQIHEEPKAPDRSAMTAFSPASLIQSFREDVNFRNFCVSQMIWNFSLNIAGPFFSVYQVEVLKATPAIVGMLSIVSSVAGIPALRLFGSLNDRWGARKLTLLTGLLIPPVPVLWMFTTQPWHPAPINILSGVLWAGYGLASFNFLLSLSKAENLSRYTALYQIAVLAATAAGAALGGIIVQQWGFTAIFVLSGIGRLAGILFFWKMVKSPTA